MSEVIVHSGYLRKQNPFLPLWKRRWFTLSAVSLIYYENEEGEINHL